MFNNSKCFLFSRPQLKYIFQPLSLIVESFILDLVQICEWKWYVLCMAWKIKIYYEISSYYMFPLFSWLERIPKIKMAFQVEINLDLWMQVLIKSLCPCSTDIIGLCPGPHMPWSWIWIVRFNIKKMKILMKFI